MSTPTHAPLDLGPVSAADVGLLRPPTAMWGYNMQVTDEALDRIAHAMRERDVTIAYLQDQLATLAPNGSYAELRDADALPGPWQPAGAGIPVVPRGQRDLRGCGPPRVSLRSGRRRPPGDPLRSRGRRLRGDPLRSRGRRLRGDPLRCRGRRLRGDPLRSRGRRGFEAPETPERPQPEAAAEPAETVEAPGPPQTPLVLEARRPWSLPLPNLRRLSPPRPSGSRNPRRDTAFRG